MRLRAHWAAVAALVLAASTPLLADDSPPRARDYAIAARYAPDFHQVVDLEKPRLDYITRFDFDGNWRADDNWENATDPDHRLPAYVYYAVSYTRTHFFLHYVYFHPRDWKGNWLSNGALQTLKLVGRPLVFPRYLGIDALSLAHENDLEGVLVVVERRSPASFDGRVVLVESFSHHRFRTYLAEGAEESFEVKPRGLRARDGRPVLFIEAKGHGVRHRLKPKRNQTVVEYRFGGRAEEPDLDAPGPAGYELLSLYDTLWQHALDDSRSNRAFSKFRLYDQAELSDFFGDEPPRVGTALNGRKRGRNRAAPPWAWKNNGLKGQWFFDPARNVAERHRPAGDFDTRYLFNRFLTGEAAASEPSTPSGSGAGGASSRSH